MKIQVCTGKSCKGKFSEYIIKRINGDIEKFHLDNVSIESCPCLGDCKSGPNVIIDGKKENYCDPIKVSRIMFEKIKQRKANQKESKKDNENDNNN